MIFPKDISLLIINYLDIDQVYNLKKTLSYLNLKRYCSQVYYLPLKTEKSYKNFLKKCYIKDQNNKFNWACYAGYPEVVQHYLDSNCPVTRDCVYFALIHNHNSSKSLKVLKVIYSRGHITCFFDNFAGVLKSGNLEVIKFVHQIDPRKFTRFFYKLDIDILKPKPDTQIYPIEIYENLEILKFLSSVQLSFSFLPEDIPDIRRQGYNESADYLSSLYVEFS